MTANAQDSSSFGACQPTVTNLSELSRETDTQYLRTHYQVHFILPVLSEKVKTIVTRLRAKHV